jgi:hypothetical protein
MRCSKLLLLLIIFKVNGVHSQLLTVERRIDWIPGVPGGIPEIVSPELNVLDFNADPTGLKDSHKAFMSAINALPESGGVVFIPEGKFLIKSGISIRKDNIVLRGTGIKTKLYMENNGASITVGNNESGDWQKLIDGYNKGSNTVAVEDGSQFRAGGFAEIEQDNDPEVMYTKSEWKQRWSENSVGQLFEIVKINKNKVTFKTRLHIGFSARLNTRIRPVEMIKHVGFENFYIEKTVAAGNTFLFRNTAYCWINKVESDHTRRSHVGLATCIGTEVRSSYFHHSFSYGGGGSGYGVECNRHTSNVLVEDNVFNMLRHAMMVQVGANGNVFGYNYSINTVQGDGETNLNIGWISPDISIHGHYPFMNLFEGNEVEEIGIGDYWGPAGPGNTYFRNKVNGEGIFYYDESHTQNVIGNQTTAITDRDKKAKNKREHGNIVGDNIIWNQDIKTRELPDSYYYESTPSFIGDGHWPLFGPDVDRSYKLPAQIRYESGNPIQ